MGRGAKFAGEKKGEMEVSAEHSLLVSAYLEHAPIFRLSIMHPPASSPSPGSIIYLAVIVVSYKKNTEKKESIGRQSLPTGYFVKGRNTEKGKENKTHAHKRESYKQKAKKGIKAC